MRENKNTGDRKIKGHKGGKGRGSRRCCCCCSGGTEAAKPDRHIRGYLGKRFEGHRDANATTIGETSQYGQVPFDGDDGYAATAPTPRGRRESTRALLPQPWQFCTRRMLWGCASHLRCHHGTDTYVCAYTHKRSAHINVSLLHQAPLVYKNTFVLPRRVRCQECCLNFAVKRPSFRWSGCPARRREKGALCHNDHGHVTRHS